MKRSISALAKFLARELGQDESTVSNVVRRCREAGLLTRGKSGPGAAEATSVDAAKALLAVLMTPPGSGVRAPERLRLCFDMAAPALDSGAETTSAASAVRRRVEEMIGEPAPARWGPVDVLAAAISRLREDPATGFVPVRVSATRQPAVWPQDTVTLEWRSSEILRFYPIRKGHSVTKIDDDENSSFMEVSATVGRGVLFHLALWLEGEKD